MTTNHTPTPWLYGDLSEVVQGPRGQFVADCNDPAQETDADIQRARANASHIVRCVNAHDELVAALRDLCAPQVFGTYANDHTRAQCVYPMEVWERTRAALAKVTP